MAPTCPRVFFHLLWIHINLECTKSPFSLLSADECLLEGLYFTFGVLYLWAKGIIWCRGLGHYGGRITASLLLMAHTSQVILDLFELLEYTLILVRTTVTVPTSKAGDCSQTLLPLKFTFELRQLISIRVVVHHLPI